MSGDAVKAMAAVMDSITETVQETPEGVPGGILYAALMALGLSYSTFEAIMQALVSEKKLVKRGQLYFAAGR